MKKWTVVILIVAIALMAGGAGAGAQVRLDVCIDKPLYLGFGNSENPNLGGVDITSVWILFPELQLTYQFGTPFLHGGVGARMFTFILESVLYPCAFVEVQVGPVTANLNVGGGWFGMFGLAGGRSATGALFFPDLNVGVNLNDWFRLGGGVFAAWAQAIPSGVAYALYINARFIIYFK
jgi:hypothetical protein